MFNYTADFPFHRGRRLRSNPWIRDLVSENNVTVNDLIWSKMVRLHSPSNNSLAIAVSFGPYQDVRFHEIHCEICRAVKTCEISVKFVVPR